MRAFRKIIEDAGGPAALARQIGAPLENVKAWKRNDSIPAPYWEAIAAAKLASLPELAAVAAAKRAA